MRHHPALGDRHFAARDTLQHRHALLEQFEGFDIHQIGVRQPMLRDENGLPVRSISIRGLTLEFSGGAVVRLE